MDMNRPVFDDNERPVSSRISSTKSNPNQNQSPIDEPRSKTDLNEDEVRIENDDQLRENSKENLKESEQTQEVEAGRTVTESEVEEIIKSVQNKSLNEEGSQPIAERSDNHESNDKKEPAEPEVVVHKTVKRKARQQNKFADGNLIPEEGDDEEIAHVKSPGPPPLDPISQILENDNEKMGQHLKHDPDLIPTTPDRVDLTIDEEFQEMEIDIKPTREELIARYQSAVEDRDRLQNINNQLHHKLADFFRKKKSEEAQNQPLFDKSSQEQEQRYIKYLSTIENLKKQLEGQKYEAERELDDLKYKSENKRQMVDEERMRFTKMKKDAGLRSASTHGGKQLTNKDVEALIERERQKEIDVITVRIENIKLKNQLKKKEQELKAKEEFGDGLHMIDFEQLKIENQTYNEKIEERNEELMKLRKKINNTVQILTHVKEKLQFVINENEKEKQRLAIYDDQVKRNRDILNKTKQSKDSLRMDNSRLKQNSGLLGNAVLLRDFEDCVDKNESLEFEIEKLKRRHAELMLTSKGIKQKINEMKIDLQN